MRVTNRRISKAHNKGETNKRKKFGRGETRPSWCPANRGKAIIIPLSKLDATIKGAAHPGLYRTMLDRVIYTLINPVRCHLGSMGCMKSAYLLHKVCIMFLFLFCFVCLFVFCLFFLCVAATSCIKMIGIGMCDILRKILKILNLIII